MDNQLYQKSGFLPPKSPNSGGFHYCYLSGLNITSYLGLPCLPIKKSTNKENFK
ncbi:hypothetical protein NIES39_E04330 [Arthrospira platensis NIES-39]|nr:hypothetical protein NIES39_E04330 [Arthrospira platensis NIES-39]